MLQVRLLIEDITPVFRLTCIYVGQKHKCCGECANGKQDDCGTCKFCKDKAKFSRPNQKKQYCELKQCLHVFRRHVTFDIYTGCFI